MDKIYWKTYVGPSALPTNWPAMPVEFSKSLYSTTYVPVPNVMKGARDNASLIKFVILNCSADRIHLEAQTSVRKIAVGDSCISAGDRNAPVGEIPAVQHNVVAGDVNDMIGTID